MNMLDDMDKEAAMLSSLVWLLFDCRANQLVLVW